MCLKRPSFEIDVFVNADLEALTRVCLGHSTLSEAVRCGLVSLHGPRNLTSALPSWLSVGKIAGTERSSRASAR